MKVALLLVALFFAVACGSDGVSGSPLFEGFEPMDGVAVIFAPAMCDISFVGMSGVSGIAIALGDHADMCGVLEQTQMCGTKADSTAILGMVVSGKVGTDPAQPADPGTYRFATEPPTGSFNVATADAAQVDSSCTPLEGGSPNMRGGSITIDSVTADRVRGTMDLGFDNGEAYQQPFDVAVCPVSIDICGVLGFCGSHTCVE